MGKKIKETDGTDQLIAKRAGDALGKRVDDMLLGEEVDPGAAQYKSDFFRVSKKKNGQFEIVASTPDVDRDHEIILPSAFTNLDTYLKYNPVILFAHDHWNRPPIGKAVAGSVTPDALNLTIEFAPTPFAKEIEALYDGGFMNTFSVGFIPLQREPNENGVMTYTEVELLEVSAVSVPANANARIRRAFQGACAKGVDLPIIESIVGRDPKEPSTPGPNGESAEKAKAISLADIYTRRNNRD